MPSSLQFGHGGDAVDDKTILDAIAANEALQFGHGGDAVDDPFVPWTRRPQLACFNSATAVTPWMTCLGAAGHRCSRGFNSATAVTPWMTTDLRRPSEPVVVASIRPRR